jgi:hypothetical protein
MGAGENGADDAIQEKIMQSESIRRLVFAKGSIEPERQTMMTEHQVNRTPSLIPD